MTTLLGLIFIAISIYCVWLSELIIQENKERLKK